MTRVLAQQWISADGFAAGPGGEGDIFAAVSDSTATESHNRALLPCRTPRPTSAPRRPTSSCGAAWR